MAKVIKNGQIVTDGWQVLRLAEGDSAELVAVPSGPVLVPLTVWQARQADLAGRPDVGVWLASHEPASALADGVEQLSVIAVNFPKFADGRGYSTATLLRTRYGFRGELRAIGDVQRDQFYFLQRCGFDCLQPAEGKYSDAQLEAALASFSDFSEPYQGAVDRPAPVWRRMQRGVAA
ncbi:MAG: DUF934 domain-containing protein [Zoogloeaceae bacterium]|nr:DUF934 domain-containing protein [Zoogloeaceae bacterium]